MMSDTSNQAENISNHSSMTNFSGRNFSHFELDNVLR